MSRNKSCFRLGQLILLIGFHFAVAAQQAGIDTTKQVAEKKYQNEMAGLIRQPAIKTAFNTIIELEPQTKQDHITLTEIAAPPFKEQKRAAKYLELLRAAGVDTAWIDKAGNVIALKKGRSRKKTVVIEGHLDTVFPEETDVTVKQRGDTLFAPGIGDDTRGLVTVLTILRAMQKANISTEADVYFAGTTGEEGLGDLRGVKELFSRSIPKIDSYISVDGGGSGRIVTSAVGSRRYRVTYKGPGGHSYGSFGLVNPHNASARAISYFVSKADSFTKKGTYTTYNVGMIGGGTSVNAIPFDSWMEVDMRSENTTRLSGIDSILKAAIQSGLVEENKIKRRGADLTVDIRLVGERPSGEQNASLPLIQRCIASNAILGIKSRLDVSSTNANISISRNVPGICIGAGGVGGGAHSLNEWWLNKDGHIAIQQALLLLIAEAGLAK